MDFLEHLRSIADTGSDYREFNKRVVTTDYEVLGVRMPALRAFARQLASSVEAEEYLARGLDAWAGSGSDGGSGSGGGRVPIYEEVMLYGLVLAARSKKMPLGEVLARLDGLIPHFDSWAHVDVIISDHKVFARHRDEVFRHFLPLKTHAGEFTKRTFVVLLMDFFMDEEHIDRTLKHLSEVPQGQYYVDMAIAWALSVALVKHWNTAVSVLEAGAFGEGLGEGDTTATAPLFSKFVHNKAIQKARESFRITPEQKEYLSTLKRL